MSTGNLIMSEKVGVIGMVLELDSVHSGLSEGVKFDGPDIQNRIEAVLRVISPRS